MSERTASAGKRRHWFILAVIALMVGVVTSACGGSTSSGGATTTTNLRVPTSVPESTTTSAPPSGCNQNCAVADDGMQYRVTVARRFSDPFHQPVVAIGFDITNTSAQSHDFNPLGGGFSAITSSGAVIQLQNYIGQASGDPRCYSIAAIDAGGTDPDRFHVNPGKTFTVPKQMCMSVPAGEKVTQVEFADQDASNNATVTLPTPT